MQTIPPMRLGIGNSPGRKVATNEETSSAIKPSEISVHMLGERLNVWLGEGHALPPKGRWQKIAAELGVTRKALYREMAPRR